MYIRSHQLSRRQYVSSSLSAPRKTWQKRPSNLCLHIYICMLKQNFLYQFRLIPESNSKSQPLMSSIESSLSWPYISLSFYVCFSQAYSVATIDQPLHCLYLNVALCIQNLGVYKYHIPSLFTKVHHFNSCMSSQQYWRYRLNLPELPVDPPSIWVLP